MKKLWKNFILLLLILALVLITANMASARIFKVHRSERVVVTNRITDEINKSISSQMMTQDLYPYGIVPGKLADTVFYEKRSEWAALYGEEACPEMVIIHMFPGGDFEVIETEELPQYGDYTEGSAIISYLSYPHVEKKDSGNSAVSNEIIGLVEYRFSDNSNRSILILLNVILTMAILVVFFYTLWISLRILAPFNKLSEYPERLSKGDMTEKLPENRNKFFGRYIWGMNMLSDKLENDRETIRKFTVDRQKFVTTMVHGIKTPAASIKLLAEAIATGLYSPDGKINEKDAELAEKIKKNADEIEALVSSAMEEGTTAVFEYDPKIEAFYRDEISEYILAEYTNRLKMNRIPFEIKAEGNPLVKSDFGGVCRILRQLMDNAIKYGDGTGITLSMEKNEEGHFITVENKGTPLPESEVSFVFNSLWRGSNSTGVKGHGIGLYESRLIVHRLGGDIKMRVGENRTEVTIFLP